MYEVYHSYSNSNQFLREKRTVYRYLSVTVVMNEIYKTDRLIAVLSQQELEFERGVWSAAMDGEEGKVRTRLAEGTSPNTTDSAGYTPLVSEGAASSFI